MKVNFFNSTQLSLIESINQSDLSHLINPKIHWTSSLLDLKQNSVWVSLSNNQMSSLRYLNANQVKKLSGVLIELHPQKIDGYQQTIKHLKGLNIPICICEHVREHLFELAQLLYPIKESEMIDLIGVTGTNGKTSIAVFMAQIYNLVTANQNQSNFNYFSAQTCNSFYSGTIGIGDLNNLDPSDLTTPDLLNFQYHLKKSIDQGAQFGAIEISSHALDQNRLSEIPIKSAIISNITQDHYDYHQGFNHYYQAKKKIIQSKGLKNIILNLDNPTLFDLAKKISTEKENYQKVRLMTISTDGEKTTPVFKNTVHISASHIKLNPTGIRFHLHYFDAKDGKEKVRAVDLALFGYFNVENILLSIAGCLSIKTNNHSNNHPIDFDGIVDSLNEIKPIAGRMQLINQNIKDDRLYFVDYAHSPDALTKTLVGLKIHFPDRFLITVFGAGGNRDRFKRPLMGKAVSQYSDAMIVTSDNSRDESFQQIAKDIISSIPIEKNHAYSSQANLYKLTVQSYQIIENRRKAIDAAIKLANQNQSSLVLVAGKGHENYQIIGDKTFHFSDIEYLTNQLVNDLKASKK